MMLFVVLVLVVPIVLAVQVLSVGTNCANGLNLTVLVLLVLS